ncbi:MULTISPECIES: hypothetical protein [unclassified Dermacoccus]|uniref:hypothetical protein n=1 Tax=unclassified Dermacoccus TaxID=2643059 RepID=UPI00101D6AB6|nr:MULTISPECIES: hypothetical protein [unclassified Dermacoccus]MBZ4497008.1 hypothetical protein [Dermacoccus sp. Tok2021]RYI24324.1 hypothetical protein EVU97_00975 [Dermacoccus sp. 147Ba]
MSIRTILHQALRTSRQMRDRDATSALRSALAAIDNAEAVHVDGPGAGSIEASAVGAGATDVPRRELSEAEMVDIVGTEIDELARAATLVATSAPDEAARLRGQAEVLTVVLARAGQ